MSGHGQAEFRKHLVLWLYELLQLAFIEPPLTELFEQQQHLTISYIQDMPDGQ
jgi:hypothetical protein